ncbi:MAG: hypothetical protein KBT03_10495 [Bacteroidales bacterium]|nr:hypothetical protein [Candidatus Scybalousia scybalohippi]
MCEHECYEDEKEIYNFTYVDSFGNVNHMYKEEDPIYGNIEDVLAVMKQFLLMCGFSVNELIARNDMRDFTSENI